jgi:hypothetical protein
VRRFSSVFSKAVRRGAGRMWNVHDARDFPGVQGSMSSRTGVWNLAPGIPIATTSSGTANAGLSTAVVQHQRLLRSCLPSQ